MKLPLRKVRARIRTRDVTRILLGWAALVCALFAWQTFSYSGLAAVAAEWQFDRFGRYFPALTLLILAVVIGSPAFYLLRRRIRVSESATPEAVRGFATRQAWRFRRFLLVLAGLAGVAAAIVLLLMLLLPSDNAPPRPVLVGAPGSARPDEGPTTLTGRILYDRTSAFDENLLLVRRGFRFAPVQGMRETGPRLRYFVEFDPRERLTGATSTRTGVLRRNALPGEVVRLYRYAGYEVDEPYYVLFDSDASLRWPYYLTAGHLAFIALVLAIAALAQDRRWRRLKREGAEPAQPASPPAGSVLPS